MKNQDVYENVNPYESGIHFNNILDKIGFINIENIPQTFGATTIYVANKK